jgi:hypothetical protein
MPTKPRPPTKLTLDDLASAVDRMGGIDGLVKFARRAPANERFFWTQLFPRILALLEREAQDDQTITIRAVKWLRPE